jgi:hypothetical protein
VSVITWRTPAGLEVRTGWDRPLGCHHLTVRRAGAVEVTNLTYPGGRMTAREVVLALDGRGIPRPIDLLEVLDAHRARDAGNDLYALGTIAMTFPAQSAAAALEAAVAHVVGQQDAQADALEAAYAEFVGDLDRLTPFVGWLHQRVAEALADEAVERARLYAGILDDVRARLEPTYAEFESALGLPMARLVAELPSIGPAPR